MTDERPPSAGAAGRPTPVRVGVPRVEVTEEPPTPTRRWEAADGQGYEIEVVGRSRTGGGGKGGADLILLRMLPDEGEASEALECLAAASSLDALSDGHLAELFERARPFVARPDDGAFFDGTNRDRRRRP